MASDVHKNVPPVRLWLFSRLGGFLVAERIFQGDLTGIKCDTRHAGTRICFSLDYKRPACLRARPTPRGVTDSTGAAHHKRCGLNFPILPPLLHSSSTWGDLGLCAFVFWPCIALALSITLARFCDVSCYSTIAQHNTANECKRTLSSRLPSRQPGLFFAILVRHSRGQIRLSSAHLPVLYLIYGPIDHRAA